MPDHIHGIIIIDKQNQSKEKLKPNKFGPQSQNLGSIVRGFKTGVTKYARMNDIEFKWQSRYHDHIIRNEKSFYRIRKYIIDNPKNW
jgi:REP element-mobilizing transposase RayT